MRLATCVSCWCKQYGHLTDFMVADNLHNCERYNTSAQSYTRTQPSLQVVYSFPSDLLTVVTGSTSGPVSLVKVM